MKIEIFNIFHKYFFLEKLNNKALFTPTFKIRIYEFYRESPGGGGIDVSQYKGTEVS